MCAWKKASADPTKDFFINMLTKDISVHACVLDLLDNCVDGARRRLGELGKPISMTPTDNTYAGFEARIAFDGNHFAISDNCGGISLEDAIDYAFHFGRRPDAPNKTEYSIGLYGIGMKRALFKLGDQVRVESRPQEDPFVVEFNVSAWAQEVDWSFPIEEMPEDLVGDENGTCVTVTDLHALVSETMCSPTFQKRLRTSIARDYAFLIQDGFRIWVNDMLVERHQFVFMSGADFKPIRQSWTDDQTGAEVTMIVGMTASPPSDSEEEKSTRIDASLTGWYVVCNGRTVLSGDKTENSVFGWEKTPRWHSQYNGFLGIVRIEHKTNPSVLPWGTTKREVDLTNPLYKRVRARMRVPTITFIEYTNARKADIERARKLEQQAESVEAHDIAENANLQVPKVTAQPTVKHTSVQYSVPKVRIDRAKRQLRDVFGDKRLSNSKAGIRMLEYFEDGEGL